MMDQVLLGMNGVQCQIEAILICTKPERHAEVLDEVLLRKRVSKPSCLSVSLGYSPWNMLGTIPHRS